MSERKSASAYRTISEVAESLGVPQHVLRFWETKFPAVKPLKRGGNRRYYRPEDIELLQVIHKLLHVDGYTIKGAQKLLKERGVRSLVEELLGGETAGELRAAATGTDAGAQLAEAEVEAALAEAGIPEALTVEPDVAMSPVTEAGAQQPETAVTEESVPEVVAVLSEAALEVEAVGGGAPVAVVVEQSAAPAAAPAREQEASPAEPAATVHPVAPAPDRQAQRKLLSELKSIRARLAEALGGAAPAAG